MSNDQEWEERFVLRPVAKIDGNRSKWGSTLMVRRIKGEKQYRELSDAEAANNLLDRAW